MITTRKSSTASLRISTLCVCFLHLLLLLLLHVADGRTLQERVDFRLRRFVAMLRAHKNCFVENRFFCFLFRLMHIGLGRGYQKAADMFRQSLNESA